MLQDSNTPSSEHSLITRDNGEQVTKVKKRKRRTDQSQRKQAKRKRLYSIAGLTALLCLLVMVIGAIAFALVYSNSIVFRKKIVNTLEQDIAASLQIKDYRANISQVYAQTAEITKKSWCGELGLLLVDVKGDLGWQSFFKPKWHSQEVIAKHGELNLSVKKSTAQEQVKSVVLLPPSIHKLKISLCDIVLNDSMSSRFFHLKDTSFTIDQIPGSTLISLYKGKWDLFHYKQLHLERCLIQMQGKQIEINPLRLSFDDKGDTAIDMRGRMTLGDASIVEFPIQEMKKMPASNLLEGYFNDFVKGFVSLKHNELDPSYLKLDFQNNQNAELKIHVASERGYDFQFNHLPALEYLSYALGDRWFSAPIFRDKAEFQMIRSNKGCRLDTIDFFQHDKLAIKGWLELDKNQQLTGEVRIGLPEEFIRKINQSHLKQKFKEGEEGLYWLNVNMSGNSMKPLDDLN